RAAKRRHAGLRVSSGASMRLQLSADAGLEPERPGLVIELHPRRIDYPTRIGDRHRPVGDDLFFVRNHVEKFAGHGHWSAPSVAGSRLAHGLDVTNKVGVFTIAGDLAAIGSNVEPWFARIGKRNDRIYELRGIVVRKVVGALGGERLPHAALLIQVERLAILDEQVGLVPSRAVECRTYHVHLRVEPISQRR